MYISITLLSHSPPRLEKSGYTGLKARNIASQLAGLAEKYADRLTITQVRHLHHQPSNLAGTSCGACWADVVFEGQVVAVPLCVSDTYIYPLFPLG